MSRHSINKLTLALAVTLAVWAIPARPADDLSRAISLIEAAEKRPDLASLQEAERLLSAQCQGPNRSPYCEYHLARCYLAQFNYWSQKNDPTRAGAALDKAETMAHQAAARRPNDTQVHVLLGKIFQFRLTQSPVSGISKAFVSESPVLREYQRALELDPKNGEAMLGLGIYYQYMPRLLGGDPHRARQLFKDAAPLLPGNPEPLVWASISYREDGRIADARRFIERAKAVDPNHPFVKAEEQRVIAAEKAAGK